MVIPPQDLGLLIPSWRPGQWEAVQNSVGSPKRVVVHNAPVGCGKSYMLMGEGQLSGSRNLILTGTRPLQSQYSKEFRNLDIVDIRGQGNYTCRATELGGEFYDGTPAKSVAEGPCQYGIECGLKLMGCTYYDKVRQAHFKQRVIANYAAWISSRLYGNGWGTFPLIMCDEAHEAEGWLSRCMSVELPYVLQAVIGADFPTHDEVGVWTQWADMVYPMVVHELDIAINTPPSKRRRGNIKSHAHFLALKQAESALARVRKVTKDWLITRTKHGVMFQPIWVHSYAERYLFSKANKIVMASATIVPYELGLLGLSKSDYDYFEYPSTFPPERRPIYFKPTVKMHHGMEAEDNLLWISVADDFISKRLDRKGIIHTVSFARQQQLLKHSRFASLMVANSSSSTATATLQRFRAMPPPAILVTPSMATGVNLEYKAAEYAIVPKMPFENPNDPMIVARSEKNKDYPFFQAAKTLLQTVGRIMRAADDQGETLITDVNFNLFRTRYKHMLPGYFWEVVQVVDELPEPPEAL